MASFGPAKSVNWRARAAQYEEELLTYLTPHMEKSSVFLSLVTPNSLGSASNVIGFEIETARSFAMSKNTHSSSPA
jgi:hypothetical protein